MTRSTDQRAPKARGFRRKPLSNQRLRNWALGYLGRFAATEAHLVVVLERKIKRHLGPEAEPEDLGKWIEAARQVARDMVALGVIDDRSYAAARARTLHRQGKSRRVIVQNLKARGASAGDIDAALAGIADEIGAGGEAVDLDAAIALARRRRLGPFARPGKGAGKDSGKGDAEDVRRRAYGVLARGGFSYSIARRVIEAGDAAELEAYLEDLKADEGEHDR